MGLDRRPDAEPAQWVKRRIRSTTSATGAAPKWVSAPIARTQAVNHDRGMSAAHQLRVQAADLAARANDLHATSAVPESWPAVPDLLADLEQMLRVLSASSYELAAGAAPAVSKFRLWLNPRAPTASVQAGLSRQHEVQLISALHDVAAEFNACAKSCHKAREVVGLLTACRLESASEKSTRPRSVADRTG
jgi:hypothetical protein